MAEWQTSKEQQKRERRDAQKPKWERDADEAFEKSGARFMMEQWAKKSDAPPRLDMIILAGLPGSGKSLLATQLKKKLGFRVVSQDQLGSRQKCEAEATSALRRGRRCTIDRCNHTAQQRQNWLDLHAKYSDGGVALVIHLVTDAALAKKRVLSRKNHKTLPPVPESRGIVDRFAREFEAVDHERCWVVDRPWKPQHLAAMVELCGATAPRLPPPPPPDPNPPPELDPVKKLAAMGWSEAACAAALKHARGNEDAAVDLLLTTSTDELLSL